MYEANAAKISNFCIFWLITLVCESLSRPISCITGQNVQKLLIVLFYASYIASILTRDIKQNVKEGRFPGFMHS